MPATMLDPNIGDAPIFRHAAALMAADRQRITFWAVAECGMAKVTRWQSAALQERSVATRLQSERLREASLRLAYETAALLELVRTHEVHEGIGQHAAAAVICSRHESAKFRFCAGSRLL